MEFLDARSALTVGALRQPIELVPNNRSNGPLRLVGRQHASFAYLGPVEWDRSGQILYGLWVHVAPGAGIELGDIRAAQVLVLQLDDGAVSLTPMDAPQTGHAPYEPIAAWGQTTYFALDAATLKRMAASSKLTLDVRAEGGETVNFLPTSDTKSVLASFIDARGGLTARLIGTIFGRAMAVPGRMSPKFTSGLYWLTSHTGKSPCCWAISQSESPFLMV